MNAISKALDHIKFTIPFEILRIAFNDDLQNWRQAPISIDQQILDKVLKARVLIDTDLVGGQTIIVPLDGLTPRYTDTYTIIFEIPPERLNYRQIMSILSVGYLPFSASYNSMGLGMGTINPTSMNDVMSAGQRVGDSVSNIPPISNAVADLIGYNTVVIRDQMRVTNAYQLRCVIGNDENLNNINPRSYLAFAKLCELAVKAYIYNKLLIKIDQAYLTGGQELGSVKQYVDNLADSNEMYMTYLKEVMQACMFMNSTTNYTRFLKLQISPGL